MNKVVILGNGFDLSHGLKTGFTDFLKYIIKKRIDEPDHENEKLFSIVNAAVAGVGSELKSNVIDFDQDFNKVWRDVKESAYDSSGIFTGQYESITWLGRSHRFRNADDAIGYKNDFLKAILESSNVYDWVDFEKTYYSHLVELYKNFRKDTYNKDAQKLETLKRRVGQLNREFSEIREEFLKYLDQSVDQGQLKRVSGYSKIFYSEKILPFDPMALHKTRILVLSFNYTETMKLYQLEPTTSEVIYIHGELNNEYNPPVFGYGDEMDPSYESIESLDDNLFLEHFKSFQYAKTKNYNKLEGYLKSTDFELSIVGHSCGLSDRVLLNHVFEHPNCKSIKIYHHGGLEGHVNTYMNISRHFSRENKAMQRSRVIGFDPKNACPQAQGDS